MLPFDSTFHFIVLSILTDTGDSPRQGVCNLKITTAWHGKLRDGRTPARNVERVSNLVDGAGTWRDLRTADVC